MAREGKEVAKKRNRGAGKVGKRTTKWGTSSRDQRKQGRKMGQEHMKTLIDAYMAGNPLEVRAQLVGWERELNDNIAN